MGNTDILLEPIRLCRFSVTHKRDLHMLIRTFEATVEQITNGHSSPLTKKKRRCKYIHTAVFDSMTKNMAQYKVIDFDIIHLSYDESMQKKIMLILQKKRQNVYMV